MLSAGMKRIGANNAAIVTSVGPVSTILQAHFFLGDRIFAEQVIGTVLVIVGVLLIGWKESRPVAGSCAGCGQTGIKTYAFLPVIFSFPIFAPPNENELRLAAFRPENAQVAKLVDALCSGRSVGNHVLVRIQSWAP
jgi:hypothetical protein